ncbi:MAG: CHC2 zinc finger domain-containing protein [Candidatus Andersenbacteria bacterium]
MTTFQQIVDNYERLQITPELAIELFGEDAREPICNNLQIYGQNWLNTNKNIEDMRRIIPTLPIIEDCISLRALYEVFVPKLQRELRQIEKHIRRLQKCLEILEDRTIFSKPPIFAGHVDIKALKERLEITDVIERWVNLKRSGKNYKGLCPFHTDGKPSFVVYPDNGRWWCFACSEGGDIISFVQKIKSCGFKEAVEELRGL